MDRNLMQDLIRWKDSADRKPLVLRGARQTGKTWLMKAFGAQSFASCAYFN